MFQTIPTWRVTWGPASPRDDHKLTLRVPEPNLESLLHVLLFNHVHELHMEVERLPYSLATDLGNEPDEEMASHDRPER